MLDALKWRYATKKFDATKKLSNDQMNVLKESIRLSATSYGLMGFKVLIVKDEETRKKLQPAAWNQSQIVDADSVFVFCVPTNYSPEDVNAHVQLTADTRGMNFEDLKGYADFMNSKIFSLSNNDIQTWLAKQVYIALGNFMAAAGDIKVDTCPMEGFERSAFDDILGLKEKNLTSVVVATAGFRHEEDQTQHYAKVRKSTENLFELI